MLELSMWEEKEKAVEAVHQEVRGAINKTPPVSFISHWRRKITIRGGRLDQETCSRGHHKVGKVAKSRKKGVARRRPEKEPRMVDTIICWVMAGERVKGQGR